MMRRAILVTIALFACFWAVDDAHAQQIRRCTARDGSTVTTDKPCAAIDAAERLPRMPASAGNLRRTPRMTCARNLEELSYEVASAIDLQDANRLASVYHWVGMGGDNAYRVFSRLETLVKRPLLDIGPSGGGIDAEPVWREDAEGNLVPEFPKPRPPSGLQIEQSLGRDGSRSTRTLFGLRKHLGCLWISY